MKITNQIHLIKYPFFISVAPGKQIERFVNVFALLGEKIHLIDTGVADSFPVIEKYLKDQRREIKDIASILLTHSHPDHIGSAKKIKEITACKVYAHPAEKHWIENTELQFSQRPVPGFQKLVGGSVKVDFELYDNSLIHLEDDLTLRCFHTPGHSAGSVCFFSENEKILISGDAILLPGEIPIFENVEDYLNSINKIRNLKPKLILSAWDEPRKENEIEELLKKSESYILHIQKTVKKVVEKGTNINSMEFCKQVVSELELPEILANPLLLKSFQACLL
ncbi:MAG: MBL fold metallo-hydrolase [Prolixibacteraceae bacterium]|nr:MBL fold metallo-hydrolase [Prolixibacteraceae bacterium]MBN2774029.1 MBL fold metallo-hydrolase [Prolixibacteraceae bacterium]